MTTPAWGYATIPTLSALRAIDATSRAANPIRAIVSGASSLPVLYWFNPAGTGSDNGDSLIAPSSGTGRWIKFVADIAGLSSNGVVKRIGAGSFSIVSSGSTGEEVLGGASAGAVQATLALTPGTDIQPYSARLAEIVSGFVAASVGQVLRKNAAGTALEYATPSGGGGGAVSSVFGRSGDVTAQTEDYSSFYQASSARLSEIVSGFSSASAGQYIRKNAAGTAIEYATVSGGGGGGLNTSLGSLTYTLTQSSNSPAGSYSTLTDGDLTTGAGTSNGSFEYLKADMGAIQVVQRIGLAGGNLTGFDSNTALYTNDSKVEVSDDDSTWCDIGLTINGVTNTGIKYFAIGAVTCRYVRLSRVSGQVNGSYLGACEFRLLG